MLGEINQKQNNLEDLSMSNEHLATEGNLLQRTYRHQANNRNGWVGYVYKVIPEYGIAQILWLAYKQGNTYSSIESEIKEAKDIDVYGLRNYTLDHVNSSAFTLIKSQQSISDLLEEFNHNPKIIDRINALHGQQKLDLDEPKEEPVQEPKKVYSVVRTDSLRACTLEDAEAGQKKLAMENPGIAFTLVEMKVHAKYPTEPMKVKA